MADADAIRDPVPTGRSAEPRPPTPSAPVEDEAVMSLVDHLVELRSRILKSLLAVAAGSTIGFVFADDLIAILRAPLPVERPLVTLGPGEAFFIHLKVAIVAGIVLAMPVILYQLWAFISPGLTREERRIARPWVPLALGFFLLGVGVAYVVLPFAASFLLSFTGPDLEYVPAADPYFGFVASMFLAFGLVMEFPIVLVLLSKVGLVTTQRLRAWRRYVVLVIAIFAAVATPGGDPVSAVILGFVMYGLYEVSIVLVRAGGR